MLRNLCFEKKHVEKLDLLLQYCKRRKLLLTLEQQKQEKKKDYSELKREMAIM